MGNPDKTIVQLPIDSDALPAGTLIGGRYRIERVLGQGGMGVVYLARHETLKKPVALKMLLPHLAGRAEFVARFHREAEALARLRHRHIVGVTDFGDDSGRYYLTFEYIEGGTLEAHILDRGVQHFSLPETARLLCEILEGLDHAHRAGIIHRDLKPANILLEKTGEAKISDFGLARVIGDEAHRALVAQTQSSIVGSSSGYAGTADFMAPEVKQFRPADERGDIYAVGVIGYWLLTGRRPSAMAQSVSKAAKRRRVPKAWDRVIGRALAETPEDRFQSAGEMLTAIRAAQIARPGGGGRIASIAAATAAVALGLLAWQFWRAPNGAPPSYGAELKQRAALTAAPKFSRWATLRNAPAGAEYSIGGGAFAAVPVDGRIAVPEGGLDVVVRAPHRQLWKGRAGSGAQPELVDLVLPPLPPHPVKIVGLPPQAMGEAADIPFTADSSGAATVAMVPGDVSLRISAPKYVALARVVQIDDEQAELAISLDRIPPPKEVSIDLGDRVGIRLLRVEPGEFICGSAILDPTRLPSDEVAHVVRIDKPFYLGMYEVTQGEYVALMHTNPAASRSLRDPRRPVEQVNWSTLRAPDGFVSRMNRRLRELNLPYTADLPTEHEWEYACRATKLDGSKLEPSREPVLDRVAVYRQMGMAPEPVGSRTPNAWGFYDMLGNVAEWTRDGPVLRGGNWRVGSTHCRTASRIVMAADSRANDTIGFRMVLRPTDE